MMKTHIQKGNQNQHKPLATRANQMEENGIGIKQSMFFRSQISLKRVSQSEFSPKQNTASISQQRRLNKMCIE
jgi:hypothetical protein